MSAVMSTASVEAAARAAAERWMRKDYKGEHMAWDYYAEGFKDGAKEFIGASLARLAEGSYAEGRKSRDGELQAARALLEDTLKWLDADSSPPLTAKWDRRGLVERIKLWIGTHEPQGQPGREGATGDG